MDEFNTIALLPDNIQSNKEWRNKNTEWVDEEQNLIKTMITKSNEQKENPNIKGSNNGTPYGNFSQKSNIIVVYNNRRDKRINEQLNYFDYKNYSRDAKRELLKNTYPPLNLDKLEDEPKWKWNDNSVNGLTYTGVRGGKLHKSKRTKKSKKSKRTKKSKKSKKSRKHR